MSLVHQEDTCWSVQQPVGVLSPDPESGLCTAHVAAVPALVPAAGLVELAAGQQVKAYMVAPLTTVAPCLPLCQTSNFPFMLMV